MATETLQIELVSADRVVWSGEASQINARTVEGELGVLVNHAPLLSLLAAGVVEIDPIEGERFNVAVSDGFISVADNRVSILSEDALLDSEIDLAAARAELEAAEESEDEQAALRAQAKIHAVEKTS